MQCLLGGAGLADYLKVILEVEQVRQAPSDDLVVIKQKHAGRHVGSLPYPLGAPTLDFTGGWRNAVQQPRPGPQEE